MKVGSLLVVLMMVLVPATGCIHTNDGGSPDIIEDEGETRVFVTGPDGMDLGLPPMQMEFIFSDVGEDGAEPSIGITSSGCIFFIAFEKVMRSCDYGQSWEEVTGPECSFTTSDPYGWVDPVTDRIFNVQMQGLETSCCLLYTSPSPRDY